MKLRVGFSTTNSFMSRAIRWFIKSNISHTYIRFYDEFLGEELIMHADWPGVVIEHAELFEKQNKIAVEYEFNDSRFKASLRKNLRLLRKKYDYWNIVGWAWVITFKRWAHLKMQNPIDDPKKLICVDFCVRQVDPVIPLPYGTMNPKSLMEWMDLHYQEYNGVKLERT